MFSRKHSWIILQSKLELKEKEKRRKTDRKRLFKMSKFSEQRGRPIKKAKLCEFDSSSKPTIFFSFSDLTYSNIFFPKCFLSFSYLTYSNFFLNVLLPRVSLHPKALTIHHRTFRCNKNSVNDCIKNRNSLNAFSSLNKSYAHSETEVALYLNWKIGFVIE